MKIDKNTLLETILNDYPEALPVLARHGFHGIACPAEIWVSLEVIAESRGILLQPLLEELNQAIGEK